MHRDEYGNETEEPFITGPTITVLGGGEMEDLAGVLAAMNTPGAMVEVPSDYTILAETSDPVNPKHYKDLGEFSAVHIIPKWNVGFEVGNALKYIQRAGNKPGESEERDLKKAVWYLQRKIHLLNPNEPDPASNDR